MSLFKARDFWSFNLSDLPQLDSENSRLIESNIEENFGDSVQDDTSTEGANFVADLGRFQAINNGQHDVLVCANLYGLILIIQIPENEQKRFAATDKKDDLEDSQNKLDGEESQRQLLLVTKVESHNRDKSKDFASIVDLKCGYFSSTTKQSIAVVTSNCELIVFQVKQQTKQTIDLISEPNPQLSCQFSHFLEEQYRIELIDGELAQSIVVLSRHGLELSHKRQDKDQMVSGSRKSVSSICLPQRDSIVVQYTNQLLFSLIDHKKVVGHYKLDLQDKQLQENSMWKLAQSTGFIPAAYLHETHSLVISLTDRRICSLPLAILTSQAKENVVKRVAKNLLNSSLSYNNNNNNNNKSSSDANQMIELDLDKISEWQRELMQSPLQLIGLIRRTTSKSESSSSSSMQRSQLVIMSRYNVDLFSSSGEHLWSQRYETSLICCQIYTMQPVQSLQEKNNSSINDHDDRLFILVCSDCLSSDKCNLSIMLEDQIVWSALLNSKPMQLWRTNAQKMSGLLMSLDAMKEQINVSYLGTNRDEESNDEESEADTAKSEICLSQLQTLDECFSSQTNKEERTKSDASLSFKVSLEASNQWPNVCVRCKLSISPKKTESLGGLLQNITLLMEYDDSLQFEFQQQQNPVGTSKQSSVPIEIHELQESTLQFHLGNCWPDRREPLIVEGTFKLRRSARSGGQTLSYEGKSMSATKLLMEQSDKLEEATKQTKSLRVNLIFKFNEIHSNLVIQEESFLLPLSLISRLTLIDYSCAENATNLDDFLTNLGPNYKRPLAIGSDQMTIEESARHDFKCCDVLLQLDHLDLLGLADELIESDLVCRGLDSRNDSITSGPGSSRATAEQLMQQRRMSTLENINLLAQSLDCRLRFKSLARPAVNFLRRQETDVGDQQDVSMISMGLKLTGNEIVLNGNRATVVPSHNSMETETLVWLHLLDLKTLIDSESSLVLVEQFVRQHLAEWKWQKLIPVDVAKSKAIPGNDNNSSIILSIESEDGLAVLLMQNHLIERIRQITKKMNMIDQYKSLNSLHELQHDSIEVSLNSLLKIPPFLALNIKMHDYMKNLIFWHSNEVENRFSQLKDDLSKEFYKFQITTLASLSLAKKLCNLPDEMQNQFNILSKMTNQIQLNLTKLLNEMEKIKKLDRTFANIVVAPVGCRVVLESGENNIEQLAPHSLPPVII